MFENGLHSLAAIEAMVVAPEQQEAGNAEAATDAAVPLLRPGVGSTLPERSCPAHAANCLSEATASSSCNVELLDQNGWRSTMDFGKRTVGGWSPEDSPLPPPSPPSFLLL